MRKYPKNRRGPSVWPRACTLPVAGTVQAQCVQRSVCNAGAPSPRRTEGTANGPRTPQTSKGGNDIGFTRKNCLHVSPFVIPLKDRAIPIYRAVYRRTQPNCHSEPVRTLAWESIRKSAFLRLPHQCAHWFAMTTKESNSSINWNLSSCLLNIQTIKKRCHFDRP